MPCKYELYKSGAGNDYGTYYSWHRTLRAAKKAAAKRAQKVGAVAIRQDCLPKGSKYRADGPRQDMYSRTTHLCLRHREGGKVRVACHRVGVRDVGRRPYGAKKERTRYPR